jgi:hypothetical protein
MRRRFFYIPAPEHARGLIVPKSLFRARLDSRLENLALFFVVLAHLATHRGPVIF